MRGCAAANAGGRDGPSSCGRDGGSGRRKQQADLARVADFGPGAFLRVRRRFNLSLHSKGAETGKAVADLKKLTAWQRLWPHLRRRRGLYFRAMSQPRSKSSRPPPRQSGTPCLRNSASLGNVTLRVADFADAETLERHAHRRPLRLLGLYEGAGLPSKSVWDPVRLPDRIFLYRIPIVDYARRNRQRVDRVIRHVLIHEIGHHFGFSDADMVRIEDGT